MTLLIRGNIVMKRRFMIMVMSSDNVTMSPGIIEN